MINDLLKVAQLAALNTLLKGHDWTYEMADDFYHYRRGKAQRDAIVDVCGQLLKLGATREELKAIIEPLVPSYTHVRFYLPKEDEVTK